MSWVAWVWSGVAASIPAVAVWYNIRNFWLNNRKSKIDAPQLVFPRGKNLKRDGDTPIHALFRISEPHRGTWEVTEARVINPRGRKLISLTGEGISDGMGNYTSYHPVKWQNAIDFTQASSDGFVISPDAPDNFSIRFKLSLRSKPSIQSSFEAKYMLRDR